MSWAKLDDRFHENRKVRGLWRKQPAALGLHVLALTYCAGNELDGHVDRDFVEEKVPHAATMTKLTTALVAAGMWHEDGEGWLIHDYLDYHPSRASQDEKRATDRERKAKGGRNGKPGTPDGVHKDSERNPVGLQAASESPDPTRPDPTTSPNGDDLRAPDEWPDTLPESLRLTAAQAHLRLARLAEQKPGSQPPTRRRVGQLIADFPEHDHPFLLGEFCDYWLEGGGARTKRKDLVRTYRDHVGRKVPGAGRHLAAVDAPGYVDVNAVKRARRQIEAGFVDSKAAETLRAAGIEFDPALMGAG